MADENKKPNQNSSSTTAEMEALQDAFMQQFGGVDPVLDAPTVEDTGSWLGTHRTEPEIEFVGAEPEMGYVGEEVTTKPYDTTEFITGKVGEGLVKGATFIPDIAIEGIGWGLGQLARQLGFNEFAEAVENPITVYDVVREVWESPQLLETAITGADEAHYTRGFDISPRKPKSDQEEFWGEVAFFGAGAVSFPRALMQIFGYAGKSDSVQQLLYQAGTHGANSALARKYLGTAAQNMTLAQKAGAPIKDVSKAFVQMADEYAATFGAGLGGRLWGARPIGREVIYGSSAGAGFGLPAFFDDENAQLMVNLGGDIGEVDVKPTIQMLLSMGIPIGVAHTPSGWVLGNAHAAKGLLAKVWHVGKSLASDVFAGIHQKGQRNLASRVLMAISDEPDALINILEPAISSGVFTNRFLTLSDGTLAPVMGGLTPDTIQLMHSLGIDSNNIIAMNKMLRGRGSNAYFRDAENRRRAQQLEEVFNSIRNRSATGDQTEAFDFIENTVKNLDDVVANELSLKLDQYYKIKSNLEESMVDGAEVSNVAVQMVRTAQDVSRGISQKLWSAENIGTNRINTRGLGDWAARVIEEAGRDVLSTPGWNELFKLAGRGRLNELGITKKGENQLPRTGDETPINPDDVVENGMFDQFGDVGPLSRQVEVINLQNYRSLLGDLWSGAKKGGETVLAGRINSIIEEIDDNILVAENLIFAKGVTPTDENLRNLEIARAYTANQYQTRWGPKTVIGKLLGARSTAETEGFLNSLIKDHTLSGARVEAWRAAINEPVPVTSEGGVNWKLDPDAPLTTSGNPNVIEAELLRRLTLSTDQPTEKFIHTFIRKYKGAIDKVPGLEKRLQELESAEAGVMMMSSKLSMPTREAVQAALERGAAEGATPTEILDIIQASYNINLRNLTAARQNNMAREFLGQDRHAAAEHFINLVMNNPGKAAGYADELARMLEVDDTQQAMEGFRGALWETLAKSAQHPRNQLGEIPVGVNTEQLRQVIGKAHPLLKNWLEPVQIEFLDELVKAGAWQDIEVMPVRPGEQPQGILEGTKGAGTSEVIGAGGRIGGQTFFGLLGINPLVATGMGRRIAVTLFKYAGEKKIMEMVEKAFRDPEFAAELINNYKSLPQYKITERTVETAKRAGEATRDIVERGPAENYKDAKDAAKRTLSLITGKTGRFLSDYSLESIRKAVRFGLLPASEATTRIDLQTDYEMGRGLGGFLYPENERRWRLENSARSYTPPNPPAPGTVHTGSQLTPLNMEDIIGLPPASTTPSPSASIPMPEANRASVLGQVNPFARPSRYTGQQVFGATDPIVGDFEGATLAAEGGIVSIKGKKPRQMVI